MKTSRYTEAQIVAMLRQAEGGVPVADLCREHGMAFASGATITLAPDAAASHLFDKATGQRI